MKFNTARLKTILKKRKLRHIDLQRLTAQRFPPKGVSLSAIHQVACGRKAGVYVGRMLAISLNLHHNYFFREDKSTVLADKATVLAEDKAND